MEIMTEKAVMFTRSELNSTELNRVVKVDFYSPGSIDYLRKYKLCLINDGQDLETMDFQGIVSSHAKDTAVVFVGIHCGEDRMDEYGMVSSPDYKGRGGRAGDYQQFIIGELLPFVYSHFKKVQFADHAFAGFSLGGLSAFDIVWNNPEIFKQAAVFSGSLWWRSMDANDKDFNPFTHRLMHQQVRNSEYKPGLKFFFQCGLRDENADRNHNGVIDSVDDTIDLMKELLMKGYLEGKDMTYHQLADGRHDVQSWARALPVFLKEWLG